MMTELVEHTNRRGYYYAEWKSQVDQHLERLCGMISGDLPDWDYTSAWQRCESPRDAAKQALKAAQEF